jgi:tetratricopeptide (TPR) repeat protein
MRQDALANANEGGIAAYKRGDYAMAIRYFERALEYSPYNPTIVHNIERARQMLAAQNTPAPVPAAPATAAASMGGRNGGTAFDQLKAADESSSAAVSAPASGYSANLGGTGAPVKARTGFDTKAQTIAIPFAFTKYLDARSDPVIPAGRETPAILTLEQLRDEARSQAVKLDAQRTALARQPDAARAQASEPDAQQVGSNAAPQADQQKIVQQEKAALQKIQHLDFSIKDELGPQ